MKTIIIADDHPYTLMGTQTHVQGLGYQVLDLCTNGSDAYASILTHQPDFALIDISMPRMSGIEVAKKLQAASVHTQLVLCSMYQDKHLILKAKELGVRGYLSKDTALDFMAACFSALEKGETWFRDAEPIGVPDGWDTHAGKNQLDSLSLTERKILRLVAEKNSAQEIAMRLLLSKQTVEKHCANLNKKLGIAEGEASLGLWISDNWS